MAAKYEFVETLSEEYKCSWCKNAIYGAVETKCCGYLLCESCSIKGLKKRCPLCKATCIEIQDNVYMRRKLDQLRIYCVNKNCSSTSSEGCDWKGAINDLKSHLDNHCPYTKVTCRYKCDVKIARCMKKAHESNCCNRPVACPYCEQQGRAQTIQLHMPTCDKRPVECPNKCLGKLVKNELQLHLKQCPLQEISCEFEYTGCEERVLRKDYDSHIKNETHKHIKLLSCSFATMLTDIKQIKEDMDDMKASSDKELKALEKQAVAKTEEQIKEMDKEVIGLKQELGKTQQRIHILSQQHLENMKTIITVPFVFNSTSSSAPIYILGYCMSINIEKTTSVALVLHPGQYDSDLLWPIQGVVKLLLLHPKTIASNVELVYSLDKTPKPTECTILGTQVVRNTILYLHGVVSREYRLLVKGAVFC